VDVLHAAGTGTVLTLLALPPHERDLDLADVMWTAASQTVLTDTGPAVTAGEDGAAATAVAFRTVLAELPALSEAERALMSEWLDRAISASQDHRKPQPPETPVLSDPRPRSARGTPNGTATAQSGRPLKDVP
jgi:hypothetical protein